jgi:phosphoglycolate phosphatase-like HAD superfamily hydrolase
MPQFPPGQTLLIDADDTLWENNVYFERAIAAFISYLNHHEYSPAEVRKALNEVERETILAHGYGLTSFTRSLVTALNGSAPPRSPKRSAQRRFEASPAPSPSRRLSCSPAWPRRWPIWPRATGSS